jgi:hypothetical protein
MKSLESSTSPSVAYSSVCTVLNLTSKGPRLLRPQNVAGNGILLARPGYRIRPYGICVLPSQYRSGGSVTVKLDAEGCI